MFRVKESEEVQGSSAPERLLLVTLVLALAANFGSAFVILREYRRLAAWPGGTEAIVLDSLREEDRLLLVVSMIVCAFLVFCPAVSHNIWDFSREFSSSRLLLESLPLSFNLDCFW